jgi:hypothetical protein
MLMSVHRRDPWSVFFFSFFSFLVSNRGFAFARLLVCLAARFRALMLGEQTGPAQLPSMW